MELDHDDIAAQLVYLVAGQETKVTPHHIAGRLTGDATDHPMRAAGGHIGMVGDLIPYARQVSAYLATKIGKQDFPGVFEYEITESLGAWLADNWERADKILFAFEMEKQGTAFFSQ